MMKPSIALLCTVIASAGCSSDPTTASGADGGDAATTTGPATDAATHKADCAPACGADQVCLVPGACSFDARCIQRTEVTCPDAGLCSGPMCAGELHGAALECICR